MFTRQHYNFMAAQLREKLPVEYGRFIKAGMTAPELSVNYRNQQSRDIILAFLCEAFTRDNPAFKAVTFRAAAGEIVEGS